MQIYVNTKRNGRGLHGELKGSSFVRCVDGRHIRWSDRSFAINSKVIQRFKAPKYRSIRNVQFRWRKATKLEVYTLSLEDFIKNARVVTNEHGEKNHRVEIELFKLTRVQHFQPVPTHAEHQKEIQEQEEAKKKEPQATLF